MAKSTIYKYKQSEKIENDFFLLQSIYWQTNVYMYMYIMTTIISTGVFCTDMSKQGNKKSDCD